MLNWSRSKPQYNESVFGTNFRQECEALAKLLSDDKGFYVNGKTTSDGKFTYKAKIVDKKDKSGKVVFVERIPLTGDKIIDSLPPSEEQIAHNSLSNIEGAKKGHEENVAMHKERMAMDANLLTAIQNLTESVNALMHRMDAAEGI